jgi:hypothetical protein
MSAALFEQVNVSLAKYDNKSPVGFAKVNAPRSVLSHTAAVDGMAPCPGTPVALKSDE